MYNTLQSSDIYEDVVLCLFDVSLAVKFSMIEKKTQNNSGVNMNHCIVISSSQFSFLLTTSARIEKTKIDWFHLALSILIKYVTSR